MDNHNRDKIKNDIKTPMSAFDEEAKEGWNMAGMENWDNIHHELDNKIDAIVAKTNPPTKSLKKTTFSSLPYGIAAMILIILGLAIKFIYTDQSNHHQKLFQAYYQPLSGPEDTFRGEEKLNELEAKAKYASDAYDDLEYKKSIAFYSELLKESPHNSKYTLFLGLSYINDRKFDEAITLYNAYTPQDVAYDEDILWYLALAHLHKGEIQTSKLLLESIAKDKENYYANTATELAAKISRLK